MFTLLRCSKVREPSVIDTLWLKSKGLGQPVRESALGAAGRQHGRAAAVWTESECEHLDLGMAGMHATLFLCVLCLFSKTGQPRQRWGQFHKRVFKTPVAGSRHAALTNATQLYFKKGGCWDVIKHGELASRCKVPGLNPAAELAEF